jgi:hypothetical protein
MTATSARWARWAGAVLLILGGSVHLQQWLRIFRHQDIGPLFLLNVIASVVVGAALFVIDDRRVIAVGVLIAVGSLIAIVLSRTTGLLGFSATNYGTPEIEAIVFEVLTVAALVPCLLPRRAGRTVV